MAFLRVDTATLLPQLRQSLVDLLRALDGADWARPTACPGWSVADVAAHLVGVDLGNVARRRDGHVVEPPPGAELGPWLDAFNDDWVRVAARLSPRVLTDLADLGGRWFEAYVDGLDLDVLGPPIWWVGPQPAPVWLDVAREYTERWVHQQQIREATDRPGMREVRFVGPVVATFVHALPRSLAPADAPEGTTVDLHVTGDGGGTWHVARTVQGWELGAGPSAAPACRLSGTVEAAWRLYANYSGVTFEATGDRRLADTAMQGRAIVVG